MKKVGIILVNYKDYAEKFLDECRDSLREQDYDGNIIIYIIDNASSEKSIKYLENNYQEAVILPRSDGNYSAANNLGIKKACEDRCEYFVIANMDTRFDRAWLRELILGVESDNKIGIAQSKILLYPKNSRQEERLNSIGNIINFLGFGFTNGYNQPDREILGLPEIKGYASGCSFIIKKEVLDKIGWYNEEYYMYHDDLEIGWKTRLAGYKIILAPKSIVWHKYEFSRSISMLYYMDRNRIITIFSFYKLLTILFIAPALIFMELGMIFASLFGGWFRIKIKVYLYFLKPSSWIKIFKNRKSIKAIRIIDDRDIIKYFSGKILFQEIDNFILKYIVNPCFNLYWSIIKKIIIW